MFKHQKSKLVDVKINGGLHMHGLLFVAPASRLDERDESAKRHFGRNADLYVRNRLRSLHVKKIKKTPAQVTNYVLKSVANRRVSNDDIVVFPRSISELDN